MKHKDFMMQVAIDGSDAEMNQEIRNISTYLYQLGLFRGFSIITGSSTHETLIK